MGRPAREATAAPQSAACLLVPGAALLVRPLQRREVAAHRRRLARALVPGAALLARPLQHCKVAAPRRRGARPRIPGAALLARPLQHSEVAAAHRAAAHFLVPGSALLACPLQHLQVAAASRLAARVLVPRAALLARPLQRAQLPTGRRIGAYVACGVPADTSELSRAAQVPEEPTARRELEKRFAPLLAQARPRLAHQPEWRRRDADARLGREPGAAHRRPRVPLSPGPVPASLPPKRCCRALQAGPGRLGREAYAQGRAALGPARPSCGGRGGRRAAAGRALCTRQARSLPRRGLGSERREGEGARGGGAPGAEGGRKSPACLPVAGRRGGSAAVSGLGWASYTSQS
jgi:hypothetical protein